MTMDRLGAILNQNRERIACALAAVLCVVSAARVVQRWAPPQPPESPRVAPPRLPSPSPIHLLTEPLSHYWHGTRIPLFGAAGDQPTAISRRGAEGPGLLLPPPPDPDPSLYARVPLPANAHWVTLTALPQPPKLAEQDGPQLQPRPHDIVQAPADPEPREGTVARDEDGTIIVKDGAIRFYFAKPRGVGHPKNPLPLDDLLVYKLRAPTVEDVFQERLDAAKGRPEPLVALAQKCLNGGQTALAEQALQAALDADPSHRPAALKLADLYIAGADRNAEVGLYRQVLKADPSFPEVRLRLGRHCLALGLLRRAYEHFARGFQAAGVTVDQLLAGEGAAPDDPLARSLLRRAAEVRILQGQNDTARKLLERLAAADEKDTLLRHAQALAALMAGRPKDAAESLRPLAATDAPPLCVLNTLGAALYLSGRPEEAVAPLTTCLRRAPAPPKAARNLAAALAVTGQLAPAKKRLAQLPEPADTSLHQHLVAAFLHEATGNTDEALTEYQAAVKLDPASFHGLCGLGRVYQARGKADAAAEHFARARLLQPAREKPDPAKEQRVVPFSSQDAAWRVTGEAPPEVRMADGDLKISGRAKNDAQRQVLLPVPRARPAETGFVRRLARLQAACRVPYTNHAVVGIVLAVNDTTTLQVGLRTELEPEPRRGPAWRIIRNDTPGAWTDLPAAVARDDFALGLRLLGAGRVAVLLDGAPVGQPIDVPELDQPRLAVDVGVFVAAQTDQECVATIRHVTLVRENAPVFKQHEPSASSPE
jgi:Flp pilus assembly protein TadD